MNTALLFILIFVVSNARTSNIQFGDNQFVSKDKQITKSDFQLILDSTNVQGSILIYNLQKDVFYSNDFEWANKGNLPASTFKIANSIIALECGVVENDSTLFKWDGKKRALKNWEQDLILIDAFHYSCVPCYQDIAKRIGEKRMNNYLDKLDYGNMSVDSNNIDYFWLEGSSQINQFQQIDFLKRFYLSNLSISERTENMMKRMLIMEEKKGYTISGKTGWSIKNEINNGWFVGFIQTESDAYFFATNIEPKSHFNIKSFAKIRKKVTFQALKNIGIIE